LASGGYKTPPFRLLSIVAETKSPSTLRGLICEDEGLTSLRYRQTLRRLGHPLIGSVADGERAAEDALRLSPDAILMDIETPFLHGIEATRHVMHPRPTALLIVSAHKDPQTVEAALAAGASGYLVRPDSDERIEPALWSAREQFAARC